MKIGKYKKSKWLKKEDVEEMTDEQRRTIVRMIEEDEVGDELKPVCYFKKIDKPWPINITALDELAEMTGSDDTDDFVGAAVEIYVDPNVKYQGKKCGGIKIRAIAEAKAAKKKAESEAEFDDAIPF